MGLVTDFADGHRVNTAARLDNPPKMTQKGLRGPVKDA